LVTLILLQKLFVPVSPRRLEKVPPYLVSFFFLTYNSLFSIFNPFQSEFLSSADHLLFGADFPLGDSQVGYRNYRQTITAIEAMDISDEEKKKIYEDNARKLFRLPI